jgi:hypothetical protein
MLLQQTSLTLHVFTASSFLAQWKIVTTNILWIISNISRIFFFRVQYRQAKKQDVWAKQYDTFVQEKKYEYPTAMRMSYHTHLWN